MFKLHTEKRLRNSEWTAFSLFFSVPQSDCLVILYRNWKRPSRGWVLRVGGKAAAVLTYGRSGQRGVEVYTPCCRHSSRWALSRCYREKRRRKQSHKPNLETAGCLEKNSGWCLSKLVTSTWLLIKDSGNLPQKCKGPRVHKVLLNKESSVKTTVSSFNSVSFCTLLLIWNFHNHSVRTRASEHSQDCNNSSWKGHRKHH